MRVLMTEEAIESMPESQQHLYRDMPLWVNIVFAGEVFGGLLGSISLLLKKKWALPLFVISLLGVLAQTTNIWFLTDAITAMGAPAIVMPLVAIIIGAGRGSRTTPPAAAIAATTEHLRRRPRSRPSAGGRESTGANSGA